MLLTRRQLLMKRSKHVLPRTCQRDVLFGRLRCSISLNQYYFILTQSKRFLRKVTKDHGDGFDDISALKNATRRTVPLVSPLGYWLDLVRKRFLREYHVIHIKVAETLIRGKFDILHLLFDLFNLRKSLDPAALPIDSILSLSSEGNNPIFTALCGFIKVPNPPAR